MKHQFTLSILMLIVTINLNAQARDSEPPITIDKTQADLFRENYNRYAIHFKNGRPIKNGYKVKSDELKYYLPRFEESKLHYQSYKKNTTLTLIFGLAYSISSIIYLTHLDNDKILIPSGITALGLLIPTAIFGTKSTSALYRSAYYYNRDVAIYGMKLGEND